MERMSFSNNSELVSNYIDQEAMLAHYLNWHQHNGHSEWVAEYRIKVVPDQPYYGTWYIESAIVGGDERLTFDEALEFVRGYEGQADPALLELPDNRVVGRLYYDRWPTLGMSPSYIQGEFCEVNFDV